MKIHEYQAKQILRDRSINVPDDIVVESGAEAEAAFTQMGQPLAVIVSQIHAGGRGKGTFTNNPKQKGVELVRSAAEAKAVAENMLGNCLVTIQTGEAGQIVNKVTVRAGCDIQEEYYMGIVMDRAEAKPVLMVSPEGGVDIEKVAEETPHLIFKEHFDPHVGLESYQARKHCEKLGIKGKSVRSAESIMKKICKVFVEYDCSLIEVNPLVMTTEGELVVLDAKITFDENSLFRHSEIEAMRDIAEEDPMELRATDAGLSYVKLDGNIGCLVNGAGLAMSTMDIIKLHGGSPANFLDVGGGANVEQVTEAFRILVGDESVQAILVNIFGGIMKCSTIAESIVAASKAVGINVPLVVRLEGTEVEQGLKILEDSDVELITASDLTDAAQKVVDAASVVN